MLGLLEMLDARKRKDVSEARLRIKICQEIFLAKAEQTHAADFFSLKGGVVLYELTEGRRGFTKDIDLDLLFYSIQEDKIQNLFASINQSSLFSNVHIILHSKMTDLSHENYKGKNVIADFIDERGTIFTLSFDIGVRAHVTLPLEKRDFLIGVNPKNQHIEIQIDPPCQMIAEKLVSFINWGIASTRAKDILDIYWLLTHTRCPKEELALCLQEILLKRTSLKTTNEAFQKLTVVFNSPLFQKNLAQIDNWVKVDIPNILEFVLTKLKEAVDV